MPDTTGNLSAGKQFSSFSEITSFLWSVADLLRGDYKQADYGKVILPFTVLRASTASSLTPAKRSGRSTRRMKGSRSTNPKTS